MAPYMADIAKQEADKVRACDFRLLGAAWPSPARAPPTSKFWHLEPISKEVFPFDRYCFDISFRHGLGVAEIRRPWELNRLQFLVPLAIDAVIREDASSKRLVFDYVHSWMEGNPPFRGINWVSSIEQALRVISVAIAFSIIGVDHLTSEERKQLSGFFATHEFWIARFPSLYSSANNHYMAELAGLITSMQFAQNAGKSERSAQRNLNALLEQVQCQILPDGVGAEQAPGYSAFAIELALFGLYAADKSVNDIPAAVRERLVAYTEHIGWLMDLTGRIPDIGDWDNSRVIAMTQEPETHYVASIASAASGYLRRPDLAPPVCPSYLRNKLFPSGPQKCSFHVGKRTWPQGGYTVFRRSSPIPFVLTFDHGPVGYLAIAAHGHADALAVWLSVRGEPTIVDAGTFLYHSEPAWRERFRGTRLHNTLSISKKSSSRVAGPFNWATKAKARLVETAPGRLLSIAAEHDGFLSEFGVRHRRSIEQLKESEFLIMDELVGAPVNGPMSISFLLDPECKAVVNANKAEVDVLRRGQCVLRMSANASLRPRIVRGSELEGLGWVSPSFGTRIPTDQILFEGILKGPSEITIRLF
jgi:hypothetical protein